MINAENQNSAEVVEVFFDSEPKKGLKSPMPGVFLEERRFSPQYLDELLDQ
jgi:hypothetical protein